MHHVHPEVLVSEPNGCSRLTPEQKDVPSGDSYSHVGYSTQAPVPTSSNSLGVAFPSQPVNEPGLLNWVGHLIRDHVYGHMKMVVHDFARRGDTVTGLRNQGNFSLLLEGN